MRCVHCMGVFQLTSIWMYLFQNSVYWGMGHEFFSKHPMIIIQSALSPHECVEHLRYPQCYSNTSRKFSKPFLSKKFKNPVDSPQYHFEMFSANFALEGASKLKNHHQLTFWLVKSDWDVVRWHDLFFLIDMILPQLANTHVRYWWSVEKFF